MDALPAQAAPREREHLYSESSYKKLEKHRFPWLRNHGMEVIELSGRELNWLLDGMDVFAMKPHGELSYETVL
jgi:hypothetical protein